MNELQSLPPSRGATEARSWFDVVNSEELQSPALLLFSERMEANFQEMLRIAGGPGRLRPHIKTHKLAELVQRQMELGITKFKCATLAEANIAATAGATDLLLAYQPVGPNVKLLLELAERFPRCDFSCLVDNRDSIACLAEAAAKRSRVLEVLVDLDIGQHRTGLAADQRVVDLYRLICGSRGLVAGGLHAYDGHLNDPDPAVRTAGCNAAFAPVEALRRELLAAGLPVPRVVAGGSPTFAIHALREGVELSPGTTVLWDASYSQKLPDLHFLPAAVLLSRVVSKPTPSFLCLDLGHKALASEMPWPRAVFLNLPDVRFVGHSEEHLVVETPHADQFEIGHVVYALPWHVCPTVALHEEAHVVTDRVATATWRVVARSRGISW